MVAVVNAIRPFTEKSRTAPRSENGNIKGEDCDGSELRVVGTASWEKTLRESLRKLRYRTKTPARFVCVAFS